MYGFCEPYRAWEAEFSVIFYFIFRKSNDKNPLSILRYIGVCGGIEYRIIDSIAQEF